MRNLIFVICMLFAFSNVNAQTEEETIEWLKYKVLSLSENGDMVKFNKSEMTVPTAWGTESHVVTSYDIIPYSKIKYITFKEKTLSIEFIGEFTDYKNKSIGKSYIISIFDTAPKEEVAKFIKGLKHLAQLKGAKFINEDLFKN
jgi:hypothetical protein